MRYLQASLLTLKKAGFSKISQANSFFPPGDTKNHIHLGTTTQYVDNGTPKIAEAGNVFVTYISIKCNDVTWARLDHNSHDGYFSFPANRPASQLRLNWLSALRALGMVRGLPPVPNGFASARPMGWAPLEVVTDTDIGTPPKLQKSVHQQNLASADSRNVASLSVRADANTGALNCEQESVQGQIRDFMAWNAWLASGFAFVERINAILVKKADEDLAINTIHTACRTYYEAATEMNRYVVLAINDLRQTPAIPPHVTLPRGPKPAWPSTKKVPPFGSMWANNRPHLLAQYEALLSSLPNAPFVVSFGKLLQAGDNIVSALETYFPDSST